MLHISSLPGEYGVGAFGKEAMDFIDMLAKGGFSYWQVLPFCMPDDCHSPYKSEASFFGNPYFLDLPTLASEGLLTADELAAAKQKTPYAMEAERLALSRETLLRVAAARAENKAEILQFVKEDAQLECACRFLALKRANNGAAWQDFYKDTYSEDDFYYFAFVQYHFLKQWARIKAYANERGIAVIGDIPIYVAEDSADVFGAPDQFLLDEKGHCKEVAGVPPDYFSADGQLWGNPLYDWKRMAADGFSWWRARLSYSFRLFDGVRIDHFRGIEAYWSVPATAKTAKEGRWVKGPGMRFVRMLQEVAGGRTVIAEDLGDITPAVHQLVKKSGFPGMRVLQFAFLGDDSSPHLPHNYPANCVAYTGTHDNNTLLGYVWEMNDGERQRMLQYCGYHGENWDRCYDTVLQMMLRSHAGIVIFPLQDLLGYGADTRMNTPGKAEGNWCYRVTKEQLDTLPLEKFRYWNKIYGRTV